MRSCPVRLLIMPLLLGLGLAACDQTTTPGKVDAAATQHLKVTYQGTDHDVDLSTLKPTVSDAGASAVLVSDVVQKALAGKSLATLKAGFRSADGYDPSSKSNCDGLLPVPGDKLAKGFVELAPLRLTWAADLKFPGCLYVKDIAQILISDASAGSDAGIDRGPDRGALDARADLASGPQVKVTYNGADTWVDVSKVPKTTTDAGGSFVLLSEVVLKALPGKDLSTVSANFRASDGYDPSTKSNCNGFLPVPGDKLTKGTLDPTTLILTWDASLQYPGCLKITGLAQVLLADT